MKKMLLAAALISAAVAVPAMPSFAADVPAAKPAIDAKCFVFPLLPDCVAAWSADAEAKGFHLTTIPNAWWTCKKAEPKSGHILDCDVK